MKIIRSVIFFLFFISFFSLLTQCKKKEDSIKESPANSTTNATTTSSTLTYTNRTVSSTQLLTNPNILTITGTSTLANTATQNSALTVGGPGWVFNSCLPSGDLLVAVNGSTTVQILFGGGPVTSMNYAFTSGIPSAGQAQMKIMDAPGQPSGINWYSKNGFVTVVSNASGTTASFSNIQCLQLNFLFPVVTVSGSLSCI